MLPHQIRANFQPGTKVEIRVKKDGVYDEKSVNGTVAKVLTSTSEHYRGIKVMLSDGTVGRVVKIIE